MMMRTEDWLESLRLQIADIRALQDMLDRQLLKHDISLIILKI
jgi:hypothetical protein